MAGGLLLVALVVLAGVLAAPGRAQAHAFLLWTTPVADGAVASGPAELELVFSEPVVAPDVELRDATGRPVATGAPRPGGDGRAVRVPIQTDLATGVYTVRWEVTGADGDRHGSEYRFAVGAAVVEPGTRADTGSPVAWGQAALRWLLFAALAAALGALVGQRLVRSARVVNPNLPEIRSWLPVASLAGALAVAGLAVPLAGDLLGSTAGRVVCVELAGFAAAAVLGSWGRPVWAAVPLLAVVAAEGVRSHAQTDTPGAGGALVVLHLAAAAVWVGALVHVVRAGWAWRSRPAAVWWLVGGYARLALWVAGGVLAAGTVLALLLVPAEALVTTGYGRTLLVKLALVAAAVALAGTGRWWLRRRGRPAALARTAALEGGVLVAVLAASAALTASPTAGSQPTDPPPPPPVGVVQPIGTLAGRLGLAIAASQGQLVVHVSAPQFGDYYQQPPGSSYTLAGRLAPASGEPVELAFQPCGRDCFVAAAGWADGDNLLSVRAEAEGWRGGQASVVVPWPVAPAGDEVAQVVDAMQRAGAFTVWESVTSDSTTPMPAPQPLPVTADWFLAGEPYGTGVAPQAVVLDDGADRRRRLRLGFPAERRFAELVLDPEGRITSATLSGPKHLIRRQFRYDD
jgi:copper transport protein